ncbi:uncharacterized protein METZ01_LOCUS48551 [marine metagenome]|uniref:Uncharacterized protein n=1 Tax=marine metagenome TaxID=408172 RepID=A0A381S0E4_9ZZZZ
MELIEPYVYKELSPEFVPKQEYFHPRF